MKWMKKNNDLPLDLFLEKNPTISNDTIAKYLDKNIHWVIDNSKHILLSRKEMKLIKKINNFITQDKPIDFLLMYKYFYGDKIYLQKGVFVPQYDTEVMVEQAIEFINNSSKDNLEILEPFIGTGSISISILNKTKKPIKVEGFDISLKAVKLSNLNAYNNLLTNRMFEFYQCDINSFDSNTKYDVIIANPPYIKKGDKNVSRWVKKHQPKKALYSNNDGLSHTESVLNLARHNLKKGGICLIEFGFEQKLMIEKLIKIQFKEFKKVEFFKDYGNNDRFVLLSFEK